VSVTSFARYSEAPGFIGIDLHHPGEAFVAANLTPEEAVRLSRALVKAAAEALGVSIQEKVATLPDGPL
jgi:hypothetical protein